MHTVPKSSIPAISVEQMRKVDEVMNQEIGISTLMMMEHAGSTLSRVVRIMLDGDLKGKIITLLCGNGYNGGGVMAAARNLRNFGAIVNVICMSEPKYLKEASKIQSEVLHNISANIFQFKDLDQNKVIELLKAADVVVDGLLGYGIQGAPRPEFADLIRLVNEHATKVLANDIPSGLDGDKGIAMSPTISAHATLTLALPKHGLLSETAQDYVGDLYLADISVPGAVYQSLQLEVPIIFEKDNLVHLV